MADTTVQTTLGPVVGSVVDGVERYAGIPFASPPVGDLRFAAPRPHPGWNEPRSATSFGPIAPQQGGMLEALLGVDPEPIAEDCLYLNVWTPAADDARRPVMVWIHGGGFTIGSGSQAMYHAERLVAGREVVVVSLNYRLGILGFTELGAIDPALAGSGNNGLRDQIVGLEWVRDNIAAFGGDPTNVTVFGESAGSMSVSLLLTSPTARGLFHRAICQSGSTNGSMTVEAARDRTADVMARLGATTVADLRAVPLERLMEVQGEIIMSAMTAENLMDNGHVTAGLPWMPVADGDLVPVDPLGAIVAGSAAGIDVMAGTTSDEWALFGLMDQVTVDEGELSRRLGALVSDADKVHEVYTSERPGISAKAEFDAVMTDMVFRMPTVAALEAQSEHSTVYCYEFSEQVAAFGGSLGAPHSIELPFLFDRCDLGNFPSLIGPSPSRRLIEGMGDAWVAFARTGDPATGRLGAWPAYDVERRSTMVLCSEPHVEDDPRAAERQLWDSMRS